VSLLTRAARMSSSHVDFPAARTPAA